MGMKLLKILLFERIVLILTDLRRKFSKRNDIMIESDLNKVYNFSIYRRDSVISCNKGFVNSDNKHMGVTHWTCFFLKKQTILS